MAPVLLLSAVFLALIVLGVPIAYAMLLAGLSVLVFIPGISIDAAASQMLNGINNWPLLAIPLFILAGQLMTRGGVTQRLVDAVRPVTAYIPGGLAHTAVISNMILAGMTGSDVADVTATGAVLIPALKRAGYSVPFAATLIAGAGGVGPLVPPSIAFILYGAVTQVSIPRLFMAGAIPGLLLGFALMIMAFVVALRHPQPHEISPPLRQIVRLWLAAVPGLSMPLVVIGGIVGGIFTPVEGSGVAVVCALALGLLVYRGIRPSDLLSVLSDAAKASAAVLMIIAGASVLSLIVSTYQVAPHIAVLFAAIAPNEVIMLLVVIVGLLILGTLLEMPACIILIVPLLLPTVYHFGIDPARFGVIAVMALLISLRLPPLGLIMFVVCRIGNISTAEYTRSMWPVLMTMMIVLLLITFVPAITLTLPAVLHTR